MCTVSTSYKIVSQVKCETLCTQYLAKVQVMCILAVNSLLVVESIGMYLDLNSYLKISNFTYDSSTTIFFMIYKVMHSIMSS